MPKQPSSSLARNLAACRLSAWSTARRWQSVCCPFASHDLGYRAAILACHLCIQGSQRTQLFLVSNWVSTFTGVKEADGIEKSVRIVITSGLVNQCRFSKGLRESLQPRLQKVPLLSAPAPAVHATRKSMC